MRRISWLPAGLMLALLAGVWQQAVAQEPTPAPLKMSPPARFLPVGQSTDEDPEGIVQEVLQPSATIQPVEPRTPAERRTTPDAQIRRASTTTRRPPTRLASVPNMFGDFFGGGPVFTATAIQNPAGVPVVRTTTASLVPSGGGRRSKIGEQNNPLPTDRIYFFYNHFENAQGASDLAGQQYRFPIDRYTFGFEKTLFDGIGSVEFRMPFSNGFNFADPVAPAAFNTAGGQTGNLVIIPKLLLYQSEETAISAGLGIELPTGSDVTSQAFGGTLRLENDAVHLSPYGAIMHQSSERLYWLGFLQFDMAASGNRVSVADGAAAPRNIGTYTDQNLVFVDFAGGYSVYQNPEARLLTRLAAQAEIHYAGVVQDADRVVDQLGTRNFTLTPIANNIQIVNLTFALTGVLGENTFLRVATSTPLRDIPNRFFDSELQAAVIQRF